MLPASASPWVTEKNYRFENHLADQEDQKSLREELVICVLNKLSRDSYEN